MIPSNFEREEFIRFCQNLPILEPFLSHSGSTQEEAEHLAAFINEFLPVHQLLLVRLTSQGQLKDSAAWEEAGGQAERLCHTFLRSGLEALIAGVWAGQLPDDAQLEEKLPQMMDGRPLPCHPTLLPIYFNGVLMGFAIFGKHLECGFWTPEEKELLASLLQILGISFANQNYTDEYTIQRWVFNAVMDHMSANLYVTDIETDKILFMNKAMKKTFGVEHPEGQICYKVLQSGMEKRCPFCPVDSLRAKAAQQEGPVSCAWEERNTLTGRVYENYDSLMNWTDGSIVHFQQSVDITDSIELTKVASTDELTDMLNRRAGKLAMGNALQDAKDGGRSLVIGMYDVNDLKAINDAFGHVAGDFLLRTVSGAMKEAVGDAGFCFRLSGDEFIIVLERAGFAEAQSMMYRARQNLCSLQKERGLPYEIGFCYGLIETAPDKEETVRELLMRVDEKMYEHKRRYHIEKSARALEEKGAAPNQMIPFDYDKDLLYDALVQSTDDYIYICNMKTNVFRYSRAMVEEFDLPGEVIENAAAVWGARVHKDDKQAFLDSNQEVADGRTDCHNVEYRAKNRRGEWVWVRCRGHVERNAKGEPVLFAGMITNLAKKNKIDHVTGLFNKFVFEDDLRALLQSETRNPIGIMTLGLDDFKHINDLYNREFGDEVIRISSQKIQSLLPINSAIYRLDGDEFGILVRDASPTQMQKLYESIQSVFSHQQEFNGNKYYCSISAGCALYPKDGNTYYNLRKYAGYSLEYAKTHGKNRLVHFSPDLLVKKTQQLYLTELLRGSVEHDFEGFELHYQVQVDAETGECKGAEALARWHCDEYGAVRPDIFIPLLEASGMILPVGKWIFKTAVHTCAAWITRHPSFTMSINLSYLQLTDPSFLPFMEKTLKEEGVSPSHIITELTESYIASSIGTLSHVFQQIRSLGIRIAMDDFGTGYSSLGILKNAPADIVKIDRGFVQGIKNSTFDLTFIKFVVELCHTVNIRVCVEGVETDEEYAIVRALRPDFIQGFLFGRPETTEQFCKHQLDTPAP